MNVKRWCGLKREEDCDASDRDGTDFNDGICACTTELCNKYIPGKRLKCYKCTGSDNCSVKETCPAPAVGKTAACLTIRKGLENMLFRFIRCCGSV